MNILYLCHRFPFPAKDGSRVRSFNMINHFTKQGHKVWLLSLVRNNTEREQGEGIAPYCHYYYMAQVDERVQTARMIARLATATPSSMGYFYSSDLKRQVKKLLTEQDFDLIFVHCSSVAQYVSEVSDVAKILDFVDMDSQKWLSYSDFKTFPLNLGYWLEGSKLARAERQLAEKFDMCTAITKSEWQTLEDYKTGVASGWFANGVDTDYFKPGNGQYNPYAISFIGRMDYFPNQQSVRYFCHQVLPLIRCVIPQVEFYIVGSSPDDEVKALENIDGVSVTGFVDDVRSYVLNTAAMVAPLNIARGTQNKILEAMALGVPVVCSELAGAGVDAIAGQHLLLANTCEQYAEQLISLMQQPELRLKYSLAGRARILEKYHWDHTLSRLDHIIKHTLANFMINA